MLTLVPNQTWPYLEERCFFFVGPAEVFWNRSLVIGVPGCNQKNSEVIQIGIQNIEFPRISAQKSALFKAQWVNYIKFTLNYVSDQSKESFTFSVVNVTVGYTLLLCIFLRAYCCFRFCSPCWSHSIGIILWRWASICR